MTASSPRWCSIGFVASERPRAKSLGSGTLISLGTIRGILTAAHVLEHLQKFEEFEEIGFAQITIRPNQPQGLRFETNAIDYIKIGGAANGVLGPDLAFIKLPHYTVAALNANSSFLNLARQMELSNSLPPAETERHDVIVGAIEEWGTDEPDASAGLDMGRIVGLMNEGSPLNIDPHDGFDRLEFTPRPHQGL